MKKNLEYVRRKKGWTQRELADKCGLTQNTISLIETGRYIPTENELEKLSRVFLIWPGRVLLKDVPDIHTFEDVTNQPVAVPR